ncbi:MAG: tetratricopeptide repeat protein [Salinimicrobium sp.]
MKKLIFLLFVCVGLSAFAQNNKLFEEANAAYANEDYREAISLYEQILKNGETSADLHYNLGNAHYKLSHIAPSIYHYEKALQMDPGDEDVKNNLEFARNMAVDAIDEGPKEGFSDLFSRGTGLFTASGWGWIAIFGMLLFVVFFLAYYFSRRTLIKRIFFICGMFFLLFALSSAGIGAMKLWLDQESSFAIVFSEEADVKSEPNLGSTDVFQLHEGTKVKVTEDFQDWFEIELPNGNQGWMLKNELKRL